MIIIILIRDTNISKNVTSSKKLQCSLTLSAEFRTSRPIRHCITEFIPTCRKSFGILDYTEMCAIWSIAR